jgi:hypothetical protein
VPIVFSERILTLVVMATICAAVAWGTATSGLDVSVADLHGTVHVYDGIVAQLPWAPRRMPAVELAGLRGRPLLGSWRLWSVAHGFTSIGAGSARMASAIATAIKPAPASVAGVSRSANTIAATVPAISGSNKVVVATNVALSARTAAFNAV